MNCYAFETVSLKRPVTVYSTEQKTVTLYSTVIKTSGNRIRLLRIHLLRMKVWKSRKVGLWMDDYYQTYLMEFMETRIFCIQIAEKFRIR
jgi:hypothetical protein